jgi:hypothetical protein
LQNDRGRRKNPVGLNRSFRDDPDCPDIAATISYQLEESDADPRAKEYGRNENMNPF